MLEVPQQIARVADGLSNKTVHDLRVVLRRCRSLVDGIRAVDPDKRWKKMRRQATELFDSLGALRDCHVMLEWVEKLGQEGDPVTGALHILLRQQESGLKLQAQEALEAFDRKQWEQWSRALPRRAARMPADSAVFQALALERLAAARRLQTSTLKTGGHLALHRLRIAVKKFRYVVENFLPKLHQEWKDDLKVAQDLLGEIHDLDVLQETVDRVCAGEPAEALTRWRHMVAAERATRIERYRHRMAGEASLWLRWRAALPRGTAARQASLTRLQAWSSFLDSDLPHTRRVTRLAGQVYDGLEKTGVIRRRHPEDRELLRAAATVHEVGRAGGNKNHHKRTQKMVEQLRQLVGWSRQEVSTMARVARYHRGTLPRAATLRDIPVAQRSRIKLLAGVLRLANALDADHEGVITSVTVARRDGFVMIHAQGLIADSPLTETIAGARHLLEISCGLPVIVRPSPKRRS
jgi:CHAD domain-containing protein